MNKEAFEQGLSDGLETKTTLYKYEKLARLRHYKRMGLGLRWCVDYFWGLKIGCAMNDVPYKHPRLREYAGQWEWRNLPEATPNSLEFDGINDQFQSFTAPNYGVSSLTHIYERTQN